MARYFVCVKSNWESDSWSPVAGPFATHQEAEQASEKFAYHPHKEVGGIDIAHQLHAQVFTRTELSRMGYPTDAEGEGNLLQNIVLE